MCKKLKTLSKKKLLPFLALSLLIFCLTSSSVNALTVVDDMVTVPPGYRAWSWSADEGDTVSVEFTVTGGGTIDFFICEETTYNDWKDDFSTSMTRYERLNDVSSADIEFDIPSDGTWYVILDNTDSLSSKTVQIKAESVSAGEEALVTIMAVLILVIIAVAIYLGIKKVRARGEEEEI